jgi:hypothetical protein
MTALIEREVRERQLGPGARLPTERHLAERHLAERPGASRTGAATCRVGGIRGVIAAPVSPVQETRPRRKPCATASARSVTCILRNRRRACVFTVSSER